MGPLTHPPQAKTHCLRHSLLSMSKAAEPADREEGWCPHPASATMLNFPASVDSRIWQGALEPILLGTKGWLWPQYSTLLTVHSPWRGWAVLCANRLPFIYSDSTNHQLWSVLRHLARRVESYVSNLRKTDSHTSNSHRFPLRTHTTILFEHRSDDTKKHLLRLLPGD